MGLEVAELEFGISPVMTVEEMSSMGELDTLCMVMYLSQFYQLFKDSMPPSGEACKHRTLLQFLTLILDILLYFSVYTICHFLMKAYAKLIQCNKCINLSVSKSPFEM